MLNPAPKNILIAPLDWGAGHTTRCIPIIDCVMKLGHRAVVAGNSAQLAIVNEAFGGQTHNIPLEGYNIKYTPLNKYAQAGLLLQMPRVLHTIKQERQWLRQAVKDHKINGVIADNRYGLHHEVVPSVIMTHQLRVLTGMGGIADKAVQRLHYRFLNRFAATWVVDAEGSCSMAGKLAHTRPMPQHAQYIGLLSRFAGDGYDYNNKAADAVLILLSGPEPQRTILSRLLWRQAVNYTGKIIFAEGSENAVTPAAIPEHISYYKRLGGPALQEALCAAKTVVCRSGYSTLMDLAATGKRAILIPTPGQTEQEYLGKTAHESGVHYTMLQDGFDLVHALHEWGRREVQGKINAGAFGMHRHIIEAWLSKL